MKKKKKVCIDFKVKMVGNIFWLCFRIKVSEKSS